MKKIFVFVIGVLLFSALGFSSSDTNSGEETGAGRHIEAAIRFVVGMSF